MFIDDLAQFLQNILIEDKNIVLLGDLNLHLETDDPDTMVFSDLVDPKGFISHVNVPTHKAGHTLDQVLYCFRRPGYDLRMLSTTPVGMH